MSGLCIAFCAIAATVPEVTICASVSRFTVPWVRLLATWLLVSAPVGATYTFAVEV